MRMTLGDMLMSLGAVAILILTLLATDHRLREQVEMHVAVDQSSTEWIGAGTRLFDVGRGVYATAREQTKEHAPLVIFVLVAAGLVILMVRT